MSRETSSASPHTHNYSQELEESVYSLGLPSFQNVCPTRMRDQISIMKITVIEIRLQTRAED